MHATASYRILNRTKKTSYQWWRCKESRILYYVAYARSKQVGPMESYFSTL